MALLVVMATPAMLFAEEPPVMPSRLSKNCAPNRLVTVLPVGLSVPSATEARVTGVLLRRVGASLTGVTVTVMVRVVTRLALTPSA